MDHLAARDPTPLLQAAIPTYKDSKLIAIIGPPKCGKTVIAGLLYDSIVNKFIPQNPNYRLNVESGLDFLQTTLLTLREGKFPVKTPESDINKVSMILKQEVGTGGSIELKLNDVAGEVFQDIYLQEVPSSERLFRTLEIGKGKGKQFGDMAFLIFCKLYVIMIDCEKVGEWKTKSFENIKLLNTILQWKQAINEAPNGKINAPIAIMFTKSDLLDSKRREKNAKDLLKEEMHEFFQQLISITGKEPEAFKVNIEVNRNATNQTPDDDAKPVRTPINYTDEEYVNFISWIDKNMN